MSLNKIPSLENLNELINVFKNKDTKASSIEDFLNDFTILTEFFGFVFFDVPAKTKVHRIRINENGKYFSSLVDLWCPPIDKIKKIGRCNDVGEQILYVSGGGDTALREINPPVGSIVTCLECEVVENIRLFEIGVLKNNQRELFLQQLQKMHINSLEHFYNNDKSLIDLDSKLKDYIVEEFTKCVEVGEEHLYKKTISIAKYFLSNPTIEALMFPSIKSDLLTINYAIPKEIADRKLKPTRVDVMRIGETINNCTRLEFIKGSYDDLNFNNPIVYSVPQPIQGWAIPIDATNFDG